MYCRRQAQDGAFGNFVYSEGEYFHDVDGHTNLREVMKRRLASQAGQEWMALREQYKTRGVKDSPMHYPTHSTCGQISVMNAHAVKVSAWGYANQDNDPFFIENGGAFSNETGFFYMSNSATMRICEFREIGHTERDIFRIYGTESSFENDTWVTNKEQTPLTVEEMRDPLPPDVVDAFRNVSKTSDFYGGHVGSHAYLAP